MARTILTILGKPETLLKHVVDRKGHDRRYAIDYTHAAAELGFAPTVPLDDGLRATVQWYLDHDDWLAGVRSGSYREYYETMYGDRLRAASGVTHDGDVRDGA
jgi:dTDP-glucose 4,6-dehydratase